MTRSTIKITVLENGTEQTIKTYKGQYRNLMELLKDTLYFDCFGECGGMGRCATCIVHVTGLQGSSVIKDRNEPVTLARYGFEDNPSIRLSCQLLVSGDLDGAIVSVLEEN
ncbi:MAG: 2Fe-2S iron-sulfur cluster binding domain-containing protein [Saprospiraceae bacterium]|jgi:2Fe-2S ferredoxin|nr:2Fe-2S iron-sulfur cluster binding domain-containing protein [Saprospiraceae bacterium]